MSNFDGCQIPCLPRFSEGSVNNDSLSLTKSLKRFFAKPWNYHVKNWAKQRFLFIDSLVDKIRPKPEKTSLEKSHSVQQRLQAGDCVRVRPRKEIEQTLDRWKELKGCAFLEYMWQYTGTTQRVLKPLERFLDERDYKVKKAKGIVLLEGVICTGTPVFGRCDRCCYLFWREEWLEKINCE